MRNGNTVFTGIGASLALVVTLTLTTAGTGHAQTPRTQGPEVLVVNSAQQPVPVTVQKAAKQPVMSSVSFSTSYTVPAGKWLVIEHVSVQAFTKGDGFFAEIGIRTALEGVSHYSHLWPATVTYDIAGDKGYAIGAPAKLYAGPGTTVETQYGVVGSPTSSGVFATFSGYLTDEP